MAVVPKDYALTSVAMRHKQVNRAVAMKVRRDNDRRRLRPGQGSAGREIDRKSTRLNSSHLGISYAVFCLQLRSNQKSTRLNSSHIGNSYAVFCFKTKT